MDRAAIFWDISPYVTLAILIVGTWWRYRYDKFGWTSRSSQLYESRLLQIASPIFHFGILTVFAGHVIGLVVPPTATKALGVGEETYHVQAVVFGLIAGLSTLAGIGLLIYRRTTRGPVRMATARSDKVMYVVLMLALVVGLYCTLQGTGIEGHAHVYHYRNTVGVWFRGIFIFRPGGENMVGAPLDYQLHAAIGMVLFCLWPFTRLVHAFSAPIGYLFRPYVVYRSRDAVRTRDAGDKNELVGSAPRRRGW
ncbi:respiratory nitrate reductase subunit gamma [Mycobacterium kyorinense]|uniref:Nitrate reductase-like protein NarX n=1 Tax=Mycobacterium kyorinense TaxID=487514 RepID=A0A1A2Z2V7_9MYCO|nr:respiratory nitrate reductase subunit gamma [Mycobacterium kyorinense]OBI44630.1 respiratory nitrate reductase subunit gamma [Mycobacterium kyorinense]